MQRQQIGFFKIGIAQNDEPVTHSYMHLIAPSREHMDLAVALQKVYEEQFINLVKVASKIYPSENLVLGGGCAYNGVANIKAYEYFKSVHIPFAPSDAGSAIGAGVTQLNFIGLGNTFLYNAATNTIDVSISGNAGAGGTWASNNVGIYTSKLVGVNTTNITGAANSEGALQVTGNVALVDGALLTDQNINTNVFIPSGKNGLLIGPVTVGAGLTVDVASGSVLVVV